jgi:glycosyltransferase involved in cell wall biosynthesis
MRIALITSWPTDVISGSGTAVFFNAFEKALRQHNYELEIIAPKFDISDYVQVTLKRFLFNTELRTDPRVLNADLVIGFDYDGYGLDPLNSPPLMTSAHAIYGDVMQWESEPVRTMVEAQAFFDRVVMHKACRVSTGSAYAKTRIVELYGVPSEKVSVVYHGMLQPSWFPLVNAEPRHENDHPVILSVGKMYPRKRTDILLQAIALLRHQYPDIELRIVGNGLEWDRLHALADSLKLDRNVTWLGSVADDAAFAREWRQADIFAHPSSQETFGYVYLEAMMTGKPIVAARAGAAPEVLDNAALLVEPENPEAVAEALDRFLKDSALRRTYGELAHQRAGVFSFERMAEGYGKLIAQVAAENCHERRTVYQ